VRCGERLEHQIVSCAQVGSLVAQDRGNLGLGERVQRALANHHAAANAGQAVGQRLCHFQHPQVATAGAGSRGDRITRQAEQVNQHPVMGPAPARRDGHPNHGHRQPRADHQGQREDADIHQPQRPAEPTDFGGGAGGRPPVGSGDEQPAGDRDAGAER
jgi:hypothetical protein